MVLAAFFYVTFVIAAVLSKQAGRLNFIDPSLYLNTTVNRLEVLAQRPGIWHGSSEDRPGMC